MADEQHDSADSAPQKRPRKPKPRAAPAREQSTIQFPYMDLETAISVARTMLAGGGVALSRDQLAGLMKQPANSGNFLMKIAAARTFGLMASNAGKYELTNIGFDILDNDEKRQRAARRDAFLSVPLYNRVFNEFRGKQLPPRPYGLEQAFVKFGVAAKQKTNARLAFDKSAAQANFFANGNDRLIEPIIGPSSERAKTTFDEVEAGDGDNVGGARVEVSKPGALHPFIQGLLDTLPEPSTNWAVEGRAKWLQAAANIFDLIYNGSGEIHVSAKSVPPSEAV